MKHKKTDKTFYHFSRIFRYEEVDRRKKKIIAAAFISYCVIRFIRSDYLSTTYGASKKRPIDVVHISRCLTFLTPPASFTPKNVSY